MTIIYQYFIKEENHWYDEGTGPFPEASKLRPTYIQWKNSKPNKWRVHPDTDLSKIKKFISSHLFFDYQFCFTELLAPIYLTSENSVVGSTMDDRWFWNDYILKLNIGESVKTDFTEITRIG